MRQTRKTLWERDYRQRPRRNMPSPIDRHGHQQDIDSISLHVRQVSHTTIDDLGLIRGEVADAVIEARKWGIV